MSLRDNHSDNEIRKMYNFKNIAFVGMSRDPVKAAHFVPKYMIERGYNIIPVNPSASEILGKRTYSKVSDIKSQVDIIDVFRPSEDVYSVVEDSVKKPGVKVVWLQEGIHNAEAEKMALDNKINVVFNRCIMAEHMRLFNIDKERNL
jgi:predicted CoA-binding protein